jgi:predicted TIM-barrel fold metal-dependent hydrolase
MKSPFSRRAFIGSLSAGLFLRRSLSAEPGGIPSALPAPEPIIDIHQLHFYDRMYNTGLRRFHRILEKFPKVNFIGHAQTWWGHIDRNYDGNSLYPVGPVTPGGLTDELLREHPNLFGDLSAASGLNSMIRDEDQARGFLDRHQDQLLFGSDCNDVLGRGPGCYGAQILAAVRRLAPGPAAVRKILCRNASRLLGRKDG